MAQGGGGVGGCQVQRYGSWAADVAHNSVPGSKPGSPERARVYVYELVRVSYAIAVGPPRRWVNKVQMDRVGGSAGRSG